MIAQTVQKFMQEKGYTWNFSTGAKTPTTDDIEKTLGKIVEALETEPDQAQVQIGRMIVKKDNGHLDVYVHIGEIGD